MTELRGSFFGHLGARTSALLDGQLPPAEAERAWAHVQSCHECRDRVEHEAWLKRQLAGLSDGGTGAPAHLRDSLLHPPPPRMHPAVVASQPPQRSPGTWAGLAVVGGGAVGAAVMGMVALGLGPLDNGGSDRRAPVTSVTTPTPASTSTPTSPGMPRRPVRP